MSIQKTPVVLTVLFIATLVLPACPEPACANGLHRGFPYDEWRADRHAERRVEPHSYGRAYREPYHDHAWTDEPRVDHTAERRLYREAERPEDDGRGQCIGMVRGVGTQDVRQEAALHNAKKDWMERVRYDHGESFVDMGNAADFNSRCNRVSIGELAGAVTYRCEIWARPCQAGMTDKAPEFTIKDREETKAREEKDR